jgi:transcriptional regulator with XRE-family HTH domain
MGSEVTAVAPRMAEVPMVEAEAVRQMRELAGRGWGAKRIARELGVARNTVRRYLRGGPAAEVQRRPSARRLDGTARLAAVALMTASPRATPSLSRRCSASSPPFSATSSGSS